MDERYSFGNSPRDLELLDHKQRTLTAFGWTCTVEQTTLTRHEFVINTLVAVPPKKPTRAERRCSI